MNVVLYLRYSSNKQTEQSIEGQDRVCTAYCEQNGYNIVGRYIDRATSASKNTEKRLEFLQMIKDSDKKLFDGVVVYKLDRFARNRYDSAIYKNKLKKNGVKVLSATEALSDNPESIILEAVLEGMAEFYSQELAQKVNRGMRETALKANSTGGRVPLGYKIENKKLVIDPTTAPIVQEAFELFADGKTTGYIARLFNEKGYNVITGRQFNKNSFRTMFPNRKYIGYYTYNNEIEIPDAVPAIIDNNLFERVQARDRLNAKPSGTYHAKVDYLLSQKLFCGECGSLMLGDTGRSKTGTKYYYYSCTGHRKDKTCNKKPVRKDWIEKIVVEDALSLLTPDFIDDLAERAVKAAEEENAKNATVPILKNKISEIDKSINNILDLVESGAAIKSAVARLQELEEQKTDLEYQLEKAESELVIIEKDQVIWWMNQFIDGDIESEEFRKQIIDLLINSVTIYDDPEGYRFVFAYNLTKKTKTVKSSATDEECSTKPTVSEPRRIFTVSGIFCVERKHLAP